MNVTTWGRQGQIPYLLLLLGLFSYDHSSSIYTSLCIAWGGGWEEGFTFNLQLQYENKKKNNSPQLLKLFLGLFYHMNQMSNSRMQAKH